MRPEVAGPFASSVAYTDGHAVLTVCGDVDVAHSPQVLGEGLAAVEARATRLTLDLAQVPLLDSSGVCVIDAMRRLAQHRGIAFEVRATQPAVRDALDTAGLTGRFDLT
jgi:anti-sigma B factor antagonist